jgi:TonB family protein
MMGTPGWSAVQFIFVLARLVASARCTVCILAIASPSIRGEVVFMNIKSTSIIVGLVLALTLLPAHSQTNNDACYRSGGALVPKAATHTSPPYPPQSKELGESGNTLMRVFIGKDGVPVDVKLEKSSGYNRLDDAAMSWVKNTWRWNPPNTDCSVVNTLVRSSWAATADAIDPYDIDLRLVASDSDYPANARAKREEGVTEMQVLLTEIGAVQNVRVAKSSGYSDLDAKASEVVTNLAFQTATVSGRPARSIVLIKFIWSLDGKDPLTSHTGSTANGKSCTGSRTGFCPERQ